MSPAWNTVYAGTEELDELASKERLIPGDVDLSPRFADLEAAPAQALRLRRSACTRVWQSFWSARPAVRYLTLATVAAILVWQLRLSSDDPANLRRDLLWSRLPSDSALRTPEHRVPVTAGVVPIRAHSHNDYDRPSPLFSALAYGYSSVEADVWLADGQVMLGHHYSHLKEGFTLRSAYVDPLVQMLSEANQQGNSTRGVFELAPDMPLQLLIDFKTDQTELYDAVLQDLEPLRSRGWLTTYDAAQGLRPGPITVVASGSVPAHLIVAAPRRDLFLDAPLASLQDTTYNRFVAPMASTNFQMIEYSTSWLVPQRRQRRVCELIRIARERGISTRFWGMPGLARHRRQAWREVLDCGVDWLNVDDLAEGANW